MLTLVLHKNRPHIRVEHHRALEKDPRKQVKNLESGTPKKESKKFNPRTPNGPTMLDKWVTRPEKETKPVVTAEPAITSDNRILSHPEKGNRTSQISRLLKRRGRLQVRIQNFDINLIERDRIKLQSTTNFEFSN